jgi:putative transposase
MENGDSFRSPEASRGVPLPAAVTVPGFPPRSPLIAIVPCLFLCFPAVWRMVHHMPRQSRVVIPGVPHHVTQRGNRRLQTFFSDDDYFAYLTWIAAGCRAAGVTVLAYCLMPNHVHLVLVPSDAGGLRRALADAHRRYSSIINLRNGWRGHLWQERFHSFPLDDDHLIAAVRYVELNPVRARLVTTPEAWRWSSAPAHVAGRGDALIRPALPPPLDAVGPWVDFLAAGLAPDEAEQQRLHQQTGRPLGGPGFTARLEALTQRTLGAKPRGRPRKAEPSERF